MTGSMVAHYRITDKVGEGGMGVVYKAQDTKLERTVALKFLNSLGMTDASRQRFIQEARAAAQVLHPNICPIFEINEHDGRPFFAMAFVEGKTVEQLLANGPLPLSKALDIAIQAANGLEAAHQAGVVHRDIKSGNIVVGADGHATILDFGLALGPNSERLTIPGAASGTVSYMSPEQAQGIEVDKRTDIWSLGVVLFEMLAGALPFQRESVYGVMNAIVNQEPVDIAALRPQVPQTVRTLINKALQKAPGQRFQSAAEMAAALTQIRDAQSQQTETVAAVRTASAVEPPVQQIQKRNRWKIWTAVFAAILIATAVGLFLVFHKALPQEKQIAVLPFEVIGDQNNPAVRALADGLVETLTAKLSQVQDFQGKLLVVPASEIRNRKIATAEDARRIYGANLVISGSVELVGDSVQFNEELIDALKIRQLESVSFALAMDKAIEIRDRAVEGVTHMLQLTVLPKARSAMDAGETQNPEAYSEYLKGVGYLARHDLPGNIGLAIGSLQNAVSADPKFALAFAALGEAQWWKAKNTSDSNEAAEALKSIQLALSLNNNLTAAHIKLGEIYSESGKPEQAISEEKGALLQVACDAQADRALGTAYEATNRFGEAEDAYKKGIECQPTDWYGYSMLGYFYVKRGRLEEARATYEQGRALTPDNEALALNLAILDMREGKFQQAVELSLKDPKPGLRTYQVLGSAYYNLHQFSQAEAALNNAVKLSPTEYVLWGNLGSVYRHMPGQQDKARACFLKAVELANKSLSVMQGDARAHANLAEYYAKLGDHSKAMNEISQIPEAARSPYIDRVVIVYLLGGDRKQASDLAHSVPDSNPVFQAMKADPDLEEIWNTR